jgi:hypothetical protein
MGALLQNTQSGRYCYVGGWSWAISCSDTVSDMRLKKDVTALKPEEGLAAVMHLRPVHYRWIDERLNESGSDTEIGFIAQEVEKVLPLLVYETPQAPDAAVKLPATNRRRSSTSASWCRWCSPSSRSRFSSTSSPPTSRSRSPKR